MKVRLIRPVKSGPAVLQFEKVGIAPPLRPGAYWRKAFVRRRHEQITGRQEQRVKRFLVIASAILVGLLAFAKPASANVPHQICDDNGYCLNDWNGYAQYVRVYQNGVINNYFEVQYIDLCNGGDKVLDGQDGVYCPFSLAHQDLDATENGNLIFQIVDENTGYCVGDAPGQSPNAYETGCNTVDTGTGGGYGTVWVLDPTGCGGGGYNSYVSRQWSDSSNTLLYLSYETGDTNGSYIQLNTAYPAGTCLRAA
jgi:hypothetical protein